MPLLPDAAVPATRHRIYYNATWFALLLSVLMSVLSAWIRMSDAGFGCDPWPSCYGRDVIVDMQPGITIAPDDANKGLRVLHRLMASAFGIIILFMGVMSVWYRKRFILGTGWILAAVAVTILLSIVGMSTPDIHRPLITLVNMFGGLVLAGILFHVALLQAVSVNHPASLEAKASFATLLVTLALIASGAWVSANYAATSCDSVFSCTVPDEATLTDAFDPFRELTVSEGVLDADPSSALMLYLHQASGPITAFLLFGCTIAIVARHGYAHWMAVPPGLLVALTIAAWIETFAPSLWVASLHNTLSLALVLSLVYQINRLNWYD